MATANEQWRAAEEREARAATVVAELTAVVKEQRAKLAHKARVAAEVLSNPCPLHTIRNSNLRPLPLP